MLLHGLEDALAGGTWSNRLRSGARALAPKLTLSAPIGGLAEIDLTALGPTPPTELSLYLDDLLERLTRDGQTTVLLLDEVQELAKDDRNVPLVASLRTSLDTRSDVLKAVFTGSSREGLRAMFSDRQAPFFHFATPLDLPALDTPFVEHLVDVGKRRTGRRIDPDEAVAGFQALHRKPYFFRLLIEALLIDPASGVVDGVARVRERLGEELRYPEVARAHDAATSGCRRDRRRRREAVRGGGTTMHGFARRHRRAFPFKYPGRLAKARARGAGGRVDGVMGDRGSGVRRVGPHERPLLAIRAARPLVTARARSLPQAVGRVRPLEERPIA